MISSFLTEVPASILTKHEMLLFVFVELEGTMHTQPNLFTTLQYWSEEESGLSEKSFSASVLN